MIYWSFFSIFILILEREENEHLNGRACVNLNWNEHQEHLPLKRTWRQRKWKQLTHHLLISYSETSSMD